MRPRTHTAIIAVRERGREKKRSFITREGNEGFSFVFDGLDLLDSKRVILNVLSENGIDCSIECLEICCWGSRKVINTGELFFKIVGRNSNWFFNSVVCDKILN